MLQLSNNIVMSEISRFVILTALMAEALPMINDYRLQKKTLQAGVQLFCSERVDLIVSGMGEKRMKVAIAAYIQEYPPMPGTRWINLGTAGTLDCAVGDLIWARSIAGIEIAQPRGEGNCMPMNVISLNIPGVNYVHGTLFDMEAQACMESLSENVIEFEPAHLFCAKVVSDNQLDPILKKDKHRVMSMMQKNQNALSKNIKILINT